MTEAEQRNDPWNPRPRGRKRAGLLAVVLILVALWFAHPYLLGWSLRKGLPLIAARFNLQVELGRIHANFAHPFRFEKVVLAPLAPPGTQTRYEFSNIELSLNCPWEIFFGDGRYFRKAVAGDWMVVIDCRKPATSPQPAPAAAPAQGDDQAEGVLRLLPQEIVLQNGNISALGDALAFRLDDVSANFSEDALGVFLARNAALQIGDSVQHLGDLKAVTAWKQGTLYLADLPLRRDIKLDSLNIDLAEPGGVSMEFAADLFGGFLRGGLQFGSEDGQPRLDGTFWIANMSLQPIPEFVGKKADLGGTVREARLTFRGNPNRPVEAEMALWTVADNVRWNQRGWESLELGANLIHQRLTISNFNLRQKENRLGGNGEVALSGDWQSLSQAPFLANLNGSINDLGALAGLVGHPFDEMTGRMSLNGSVSGSAGKLDGFLTIEGSQIGYRAHPIESAKIDIRFAGDEAQFERCEIWSGNDYLRAQGSMGIQKPWHYSGELQARTLDLAAYAALFHAPGAASLYSGSLQLRWQGDGTPAANSGAFTLSVDKLVSQFTPSGLTGRFAATYSPENLYFSNLELAHRGLLFSTRATAAKNGLTLKDASLRSGTKEVAEGEIFLPLDIFAMAGGASWQKAFNSAKPFFATASTHGELALADLSALVGQQLPATGTVKMDLSTSGSILDPQVAGTFEASNIVVKDGDAPKPPTTVKLDLSSHEERAQVAGIVRTDGFPPVTLQVSAPIGFTQQADGSLQWRNPEGTVDGKLDFPKTDAMIFQPLLPWIHGAGGPLSGSITLAGSFHEPRLNGSLVLRNGWIELPGDIPRVENANLSLLFDSQKMTISQAAGTISGGPVGLSGGIDFSNPANLAFDLSANGSKVLLADNSSLRVRGDFDLAAKGNNGGGMVAGSLRLIDGRFLKQIEITPRTISATSANTASAPIDFPRVSKPFTDWKLDLSVTNETPFFLEGGVASGQILPNLRLTGTLGRPIPEGQIEVRQARAYLPFTTAYIDSGMIRFDAATPGMPILDVRASTDILDYQIQLYAFGASGDRKVLLRSEPPLSQEQLVTLLTTGIAPPMSFGSPEAIFDGKSALGSFVRHAFDAETAEKFHFNDPETVREAEVPASAKGVSEGLYNSGATYSLEFR